jgi:type I restriction enzyme S subunit
MSFPRYERYKDSGVEWLGEVPEHWEVRKLRHAARIENGRDHKEIEVEEGGYPVFGSGGAFARASSFLSEKPSVLLGRKGTIDRPLYVDEPFWTVDTSFYTVVSEDMDAKFLYYQCLGIPFSFYSNGTALPSMTQTTLYEVPSLRPTIIEQQRIVLFVDSETAKIDGLIEEQRRLIELLKEKRQAVISHAITKGLNPNAPMKDTGMEVLGKIPSHWNCGPLKHFAKVIDCKHVTVEFVDAGKPIVSIRELKNDRIELSEAKLASEEEWEFLREGRVPATGDLIICRNASVGAVGEVTSGMEFSMGQDVCLVRPSIPGGFDFFMLISGVVRQQIDALLVGTTIRRLNVEAIRGLIVADPPKGERLKIARYLRSEAKKCDALVSEAVGVIELLQERRSALISAAVTGKIDVRNYVPKEAA